MPKTVVTLKSEVGDFALDMGNKSMIPAQEIRCPGCIPPDGMISGYPYKSIEACQVSEQIYGHAARNHANRIEKSFIRNYNGALIVVKSQGCLPLKLTPEHEVLVVHGIKRNFGKPRIKLGKPMWVKASNLIPRPDPYAKNSNGQYLLMPSAKGYYSNRSVSLLPFLTKNGRVSFLSKGFSHLFPLNQKTAWLLGLYVADGSATLKEITFYLGENELQLQERTKDVINNLGFSASAKIIPGEKCIEVYLRSRVLARAFKNWCGSKAHQKYIPRFIIDHYDDLILLSFLSGYMAGDGYIRDINSKTWDITGTTVSKGLALQMQLLGARLGQLMSVRETKNGVPSQINGRQIKGNGSYYKIELRAGNITKELGFSRIPGRVKYRRLRHYLAIPINAIEKVMYSGPVSNLQTRNSTYLYNNLVVHNCGRFLGYQAIAWGAIRIKCTNSKCKNWVTLDISPNK